MSLHSNISQSGNISKSRLYAQLCTSSVLADAFLAALPKADSMVQLAFIQSRFEELHGRRIIRSATRKPLILTFLHLLEVA